MKICLHAHTACKRPWFPGSVHVVTRGNAYLWPRRWNSRFNSVRTATLTVLKQYSVVLKDDYSTSCLICCHPLCCPLGFPLYLVIHLLKLTVGVDYSVTLKYMEDFEGYKMSESPNCIYVEEQVWEEIDHFLYLASPRSAALVSGCSSSL